MRTCYNGFGRGLLAELFNLSGVIGVTVLTVNYGAPVARWVLRWLRWEPTFTTFVVVWLFFLTLVFGMRFLLKIVTGAVKWERLHWTIQGIGLILGGLRGLWWTGFLLLGFWTSGFDYLRESVEHAVLGPRLLTAYREALVSVSDHVPGARFRTESLLPPLKPVPDKRGGRTSPG